MTNKPTLFPKSKRAAYLRGVFLRKKIIMRRFCVTLTQRQKGTFMELRNGK